MNTLILINYCVKCFEYQNKMEKNISYFDVKNFIESIVRVINHVSTMLDLMLKRPPFIQCWDWTVSFNSFTFYWSLIKSLISIVLTAFQHTTRYLHLPTVHKSNAALLFVIQYFNTHSKTNLCKNIVWFLMLYLFFQVLSNLWMKFIRRKNHGSSKNRFNHNILFAKKKLNNN